MRFAFALVAITILAGSGNALTGMANSADSVPITYEVHGQGTPGKPALVFVHGWSCRRSYWREQVPVFSRDFKVVTIDLAGHGDSGKNRKAWTMEAFGDDVAAVVNQLGLKRVILIGHSMGGDVIVAAASRLPGRVAGLVWVDTYKQLRTPRTPEQVEAFAAPFRANFVEHTRTFVRGMFSSTADPALVDRVVREMSAAPPAIAVPALESAFGFSRMVPGALDKLKLGVVAINPDSPPTDVESMKSHGVEVVFISGVGHFVMLEAPERFNAMLRKAIDKFR